MLGGHETKRKLIHRKTNKSLYVVKDHRFREEKVSLESYGKRVARRVYSFQAWEAPGCGKVKGVPAHGRGYYREEMLGIKD